MILLDKNENQYGPSPKCYEVVKNLSMEMFNSYSRDYPRLIKERLSKEFNVEPKNIMLGYGSEDLLKAILQYFLKPGDKAVIPDQSWWYYKAIVDDLNAEKILYELDEHEESFEWNVDEIVNMIETHHPKIILVCSPNNPTGNSISYEGITRIMQSAGEDTIVLIDEAYWGFTKPLFKDEHAIQNHKNIAILRTFSKFYALAGVRIGFAFVGDNLINCADYHSRYLGYNRISEKLTFAALDSKEYYMECAEKMRKDKERLFNFFKEKGAKPFKSHANFMLVRLDHTSFEILKKGMEESEIVFKFFSEPIFKDCIRITIGTEEQTDQLLERLKAIL
jgi:histidinol-phosphate aminotransferase